MCHVPHPGDPAWPMIFDARLRDLQKKRAKLHTEIHDKIKARFTRK